jgi:arylsulfatase A-like enzyme
MPRNVVLVTLDSVREDFFDEYAPRLRERADIVFMQCRAASGWSVPSHASMLTGQLPHQHGIHVYDRDFSGLSREDTFLGDLPDHRALGASANVYASEAFGFDTPFDAYRSVSPDRRFPDGMDVERWGQECDEDGLARYAAFVRAALSHDHPLASLGNGILVEIAHRVADAPFPTPFDDGARLVAKESRRLVGDEPEPFVLFTNFMDAHGPFHHVWGYDDDLHDVPRSWDSGDYGTHTLNTEGVTDENRHHVENTRGLYGTAIDYLDRKVCDLVDWLHAHTDGETTVVVTADHGENLGYPADEELLAHKGVLTEGLLHVPLLVLNAPDGNVGIDESRYVSHLALGELLVGLANGRVPDPTADRIPAERIGSNMADDASDEDRAEWDRMIRVVYDAETKYQWDSESERRCYRLDVNRPNWQEPVGSDVPVGDLEPAFFDEPLKTYKRKAWNRGGNVAVDNATQGRLEDLGYL